MGASYQYLNLSSTGKNYFEQKKLMDDAASRRAAETERIRREDHQIAGRRWWWSEFRAWFAILISVFALAVAVISLLQSTGLIDLRSMPVWERLFPTTTGGGVSPYTSNILQ